MNFPSEFSWRHLPAYACANIRWWLSYMQAWNSIHILDQQKPTLHIYTDASSLKGLGDTIQGDICGPPSYSMMGASLGRQPCSLPCGQHGDSSKHRLRNQPKPSSHKHAQVDRHASSVARFF